MIIYLKTRMIEYMSFEEQIDMLSTISEYFDCRTMSSIVMHTYHITTTLN